MEQAHFIENSQLHVLAGTISGKLNLQRTSAAREMTPLLSTAIWRLRRRMVPTPHNRCTVSLLVSALARVSDESHALVQAAPVLVDPLVYDPSFSSYA